MPEHSPALPPNAIARIRKGDARAFESVFRTYYAALASFAFRFVRDAASAEDVVQDVFATIWASRDRLVVTTSLRAYLYAAVRNRALNIRKHDTVVEAWERDDAPDNARDLHPSPPTPEQILDDQQLAARLAEAFEALPERQAQVMRLRWKEEMSYAEIAEALDISIKGVEKHLSRGMSALRGRMSRRD